MNPYTAFDQIDLALSEGKLRSYSDPLSGGSLKGLPKWTGQNGAAKIYALKEGGLFLYVGATMRPLTERIRSGLSASGKYGYHGYKWKHKEQMRLFAWQFADLTKEQMEAVEAELVYSIRQGTGEWPLLQNEIHFNNIFPAAKEYAMVLFATLAEGMLLNEMVPGRPEMEGLFRDRPLQWGLRGDRYLWEALQRSMFQERVPSSVSQFEELLRYHFERLTGHKPSAGENFYVEQFAFGGMSGGMVSCDFWLKQGFPLLLTRFQHLIAEPNTSFPSSLGQ